MRNAFAVLVSLQIFRLLRRIGLQLRLQLRPSQAQAGFQQLHRFGSGGGNRPRNLEGLIEDGPGGNTAFDEPKAFRLASGDR